MRKFETPEIEILKFRIEDILTTSGREDEDGGEWAQQSLELPVIEG